MDSRKTVSDILRLAIKDLNDYQGRLAVGLIGSDAVSYNRGLMNGIEFSIKRLQKFSEIVDDEFETQLAKYYDV